MRNTIHLLLAFASCYAVAVLLNAFVVPVAAIWVVCVPLAVLWAHAIYKDFTRPPPADDRTPEQRVHDLLVERLKGRVATTRIVEAQSRATRLLAIGHSEAVAFRRTYACAISELKRCEAEILVRAA